MFLQAHMLPLGLSLYLGHPKQACHSRHMILLVHFLQILCSQMYYLHTCFCFLVWRFHGETNQGGLLALVFTSSGRFNGVTRIVEETVTCSLVVMLFFRSRSIERTRRTTMDSNTHLHLDPQILS